MERSAQTFQKTSKLKPHLIGGSIFDMEEVPWTAGLLCSSYSSQSAYDKQHGQVAITKIYTTEDCFLRSNALRDLGSVTGGLHVKF